MLRTSAPLIGALDFAMSPAALAFLVAPAVCPVIFMMFTLFFGKELDRAADAMTFLAMSVVTYASALALGYPAYLFFEYFGLKAWWQYLLGGAAVGVIPPVIVMVGTSPLIEWSFGSVISVIACSAIGTITAAIFWVLACDPGSKLAPASANVVNAMDSKD